ncbi:hypothetical protein RhiirA5_410420 [Rhizophagus irregularis]|uniref:F-box domain-containing protein n=2 Tax=Rhizophagus irregularis TaxID=588596 RepID=A0A2N0Q3J1_9GLOM|nr:hypothetical protein GLOIN_2v1769477 [Rhizophagus irregularis DAOM 181602=DAOM 197198]PKC13598.1 hypothetical protein RhiirA5_410420 [Rhizophagus irregularis]PKC73600.1 hypothetical protein RhiirA1_451011 [Rhizophagus irregularis]POG76052.1 hypothetical protein GLOIN_2v1769477 [Rhizophagus irregularis DAOM 181602=DAOM 197198]UZO11484.1 hypothetical protein OCT59_003052 [Rhizophagus irregularis]CAB4481336.1 unnamed protein product [Rhizophagus irregularis]|eukprot:XP_025182918.1 hypothetical protein GLOIN_2v1769477 [Rhizophagus irregularis DAOM 181602=DAOM 197198]
MTLPYLPDDCIYNILQNLQSERSTLFNCLLVNRFWCKSTIPLLYANPFVNITGKNYAIILTLILCFDKEEILQLKKLLKQNQININIDEEHKPLFEYLKYLKNYNYLVINSAIERCFIGAITQYRIKYYSNYTIPIFPIFHQSILRHSINVKQLDISSNIFYNKGFKNLDIQNFTSNLTKLNILSLKFHLNDNLNEIEQEFLGNIANVCLNLKKLIIQVHGQRTIFNNLSNTNTNNMEKLCTIIQKQNKLKYFKITSWHLLLNNILLSLEFQKHSLVQIEFIDTDFNNNVGLKNFKNLYNLKYLYFVTCKSILLDQCEGLNFASLKGLSLKRNIWNNDVTSLMIKYLGASLKSLLIGNLSKPLIENILMFCSNLILLRITFFFNFNFDLSILSYFKNLRIRTLIINISYNSHEFFINLANNIPNNITEISIHSHCYNRLLRFKDFLENCHNNFKIINLNYFIKLEFLNIVLNYIERSNNSLEILGMQKLDKELNDEESKLLNQIKDKGVKIVEFNIYNDNRFDICDDYKDV